MFILNQHHTIHSSKPSSHATLLTLIALSTQQIARLGIMHDAARLLIPEAGTIDAELADDAAALDVTVAQDEIVQGRRRDDLHEDVRFPVALGQRRQEGWDRAAVDVVAAAFTLGLEHVAGAERGVEGELARCETGRAVVEGEDVGEGLGQRGDVGLGRRVG